MVSFWPLLKSGFQASTSFLPCSPCSSGAFLISPLKAVPRLLDHRDVGKLFRLWVCHTHEEEEGDPADRQPRRSGHSSAHFPLLAVQNGPLGVGNPGNSFYDRDNVSPGQTNTRDWIGIALPSFIPPSSAAFVSLTIAFGNAPVIAYISGTLGTLFGADLLNIHKIGNLGAPVASIGGAGTFDGIFLNGILAVLLSALFA